MTAYVLDIQLASASVLRVLRVIERGRVLVRNAWHRRRCDDERHRTLITSRSPCAPLEHVDLLDAPGFAALDGAAELGSIPAEVDPGSVKWRIEWTNLLDIQLASASVLRVIERGREVREVVCLSGTPQASQVKLIASRISAMCEPGTR